MRLSRAAARAALLSLALQASAQVGSQDRPDRVRYEGKRSVVVFEAGVLTPSEMERFARLADAGVLDVATYLSGGAPAPDPPRITFVVRSGLSMSRSFRRTVMLPAERVRADAAPYLHETTHVLAPARTDCLWLSEGFASYVQSYVAEHMGGYDGYVFSWGGNRNVDRMALRYLRSERGQAVLRFVAAEGGPDRLWEERRQVAAPFYVLAHSFVKFLVERAGLACVKDLLQASDVAAALLATTHRSPEQWKADWLQSIGANTRG